MMSRDEARHAGFLNKAMSDFNLALDLGFLTKNRCAVVLHTRRVLPVVLQHIIPEIVSTDASWKFHHSGLQSWTNLDTKFDDIC